MRSVRAVLASVAVVAALLVPATASHAADDGADASTVIDGVVVTVPGVETAADLEYLLDDSAESITILMDPDTGELIEVSPTGDEPIAPLATTSKNTCSAGNLCLKGLGVPYANIGFTGAGTKSGTWKDRSGFTSGDWYSQVSTKGKDGKTVTVLPAVRPGVTVKWPESTWPVTVSHVRLSTKAIEA